MNELKNVNAKDLYDLYQKVKEYVDFLESEKERLK